MVIGDHSASLLLSSCMQKTEMQKNKEKKLRIEREKMRENEKKCER